MAQALETPADLVMRLLDSDTSGGVLRPSDFAKAAVVARDEQIAAWLEGLARLAQRDSERHMETAIKAKFIVQGDTMWSIARRLRGK